jgi:uncharacterized membrane protein YgdD (TMEM256/DUF423 family)
MNSTIAFRISAVVGFLAVALGAFGAHGLQPLLLHNGTTEIWGKAASYHLIHAVVLLLLAKTDKSILAWGLFLAGVLIFSGSLYVLALTGFRWMGAITPIGGICLLAGWATLAFKRTT